MTLAVYTYFIACLFGRQYLLPTQYKVVDGAYVPTEHFPQVSTWTSTKNADTINIIGYDDNMADFYIPVFTILQYLFYMGWLKVHFDLDHCIGKFGNSTGLFHIAFIKATIFRLIKIPIP